MVRKFFVLSFIFTMLSCSQMFSAQNGLIDFLERRAEEHFPETMVFSILGTSYCAAQCLLKTALSEDRMNYAIASSFFALVGITKCFSPYLIYKLRLIANRIEDDVADDEADQNDVL